MSELPAPWLAMGPFWVEQGGPAMKLRFSPLFVQSLFFTRYNFRALV